VSLPRHTLTPARSARRHRIARRAVAVLSIATAATLLPAAAQAAPWPGHPDRSIVRHAVRPGETATGLAVRYHAWTDELLRLNRLGSTGTIYRGQVLRIPVVLSAVRRAGGQTVTRPERTGQRSAAPHRRTHKHHGRHHRRHPRPLLVHSSTPRPGWRHDQLTRTQVRHLVARMARRYDVPPALALGIAWQESGWQQRRVSRAGALGVMQVMPDTGRWMRWYAGRTLRLRDTHDNIQAGVLTLRVLRAWTKYDRNAIAAYYQGLGAVRRHGYYKGTKRYVAAVRAHQRRLVRTGSPL
jgi:LysM repeat protein